MKTYPLLTAMNRGPLRHAPPAVEAIRAGDTVTIRTPHGSTLRGRVVMPSAAGGWVLNGGGRHGTPLLADVDNIVAVRRAKGGAL